MSKPEKSKSKKKTKQKKEFCTTTLTFSECVENHKGNQCIGQLAKFGISNDLLHQYAKLACWDPKSVELYNLADLVDKKKYPEAYASLVESATYVLVIRQMVQQMGLCTKKWKKELKTHQLDSKALMNSEVCTKHARHNCCYANQAQEPCYEEGKGTVIAFSDAPITQTMQKKLGETFGDEAKDLLAERNEYFQSTCGIGWHGDTERRKVFGKFILFFFLCFLHLFFSIGIRIGSTMSLCYLPFYKYNPVGDKLTLLLNNGDGYVMSHYATGFNRQTSSETTFRHSAGHKKYTDVPKPKLSKEEKAEKKKKKEEEKKQAKIQEKTKTKEKKTIKNKHAGKKRAAAAAPPAVFSFKIKKHKEIKELEELDDFEELKEPKAKRQRVI
jgi:hypothetical protein